MRKSTARTQNYRAGHSRGPVALATFRDQMADYARAEHLRELRAATHLSREKVAAEIGVTTKTLFSWENGGKIRWPNAKKLGAFYGVDPESLVSREIPAAAGSVNGGQPSNADIDRKLDLLIEYFGIEQTEDGSPTTRFAAAFETVRPVSPAKPSRTASAKGK